MHFKRVFKLNNIANKFTTRAKYLSASLINKRVLKQVSLAFIA
jgi:hypothetical protein